MILDLARTRGLWAVFNERLSIRLEALNLLSTFLLKAF